MVKLCRDNHHSVLQIVNLHSKHISAQFQVFNVPFIFEKEHITHDADMYIIAIKDAALSDMQLPVFKEKQIIVHTSGSVPLDVLSKFVNNYGVLYPLQTLRKNHAISTSTIPLLIEASNMYTKMILEQFSNTLSDTVYYVNSEKRALFHVHATIINNFINHLLYLTKHSATTKELDFSLLQPLMRETVTNAFQNDPYEMQTGPARRNDINTIEFHKNILKNDVDLLKIYDVITTSILMNYSNK